MGQAEQITRKAVNKGGSHKTSLMCGSTMSGEAYPEMTIHKMARMPPNERRTYLRPVARAMERARDVLPTPGGPTKQRIGAFESGASFRTARNSRIRSLT